MSLVLDASITMSWFFADEAGNHETLRAVTYAGAHVPSLWRLEVANAMKFAIKRKRMDGAARDKAIGELKALSIIVDPDTDRHAWAQTLRLADQFHLTLYDAAYLELARRLGLPLATRDDALAKAARASDLDVLGR